MQKLQFILAMVVVIGFTALTAVLFVPAVQNEAPQWIQENMTAVFVAWISQFGTVINYFFGSSKGSSDKNVLLASNKNP